MTNDEMVYVVGAVAVVSIIGLVIIMVDTLLLLRDIARR